MTDITLQRWNSEHGPVSEAALRHGLEQLGYRVSKYVYPPGTAFPEHTHDVDKIDAVVEGQFRIVIEGRPLTLGPGDWVAVPKGVHHSAAVIGEEAVVSLDAVSMPRRP